MDIAELRNKLNNIAAELAEQDVQQEDITIEEDSYDHTSSDGHEIKDVTDYDDYDGYSVKLETPLGPVTAEWNSQGGRGFFGGIRASNRTLESMIGKIYGEMHDFESMDKMDWPVAVGKAVDKVMSMAKDNPSFMRSESVEEDDMSTGTAGGVAGQGKKRRATGINDNPYDHNEGQDLAALVNAALWNMKDVYQTVLAGEELGEMDIFSYGDLVQYLEMEELPDTYSEFYDLVSDAIDSASGGKEFNPGDAIVVDKNIAPKIKTLYQQFKAATAKIEGIKEDSVEEVHEEEAVEETVEVPVAALAELMQLAGYANYADKLQEYENEPEEEYQDAEDQLIGLSGGLNGPKKMYPAAAGGDNPMNQEPREIEESMGLAEVENTLYKSYKAFLEEAEINNEK